MLSHSSLTPSLTLTHHGVLCSHSEIINRSEMPNNFIQSQWVIEVVGGFSVKAVVAGPQIPTVGSSTLALAHTAA